MKLLSPTLYAAIALSFAFSGPASSIAAPITILKVPTLSSNLENIQYRGKSRQRNNRPGRFRNDGMTYGGDSAYFNNHRGYRNHRRGYRQHGGWWFPPAAFLTGAIIGGTMNSGDYGDSHRGWCYDRYNSYRESDNSFQPYGGGSRRPCNSPYS